MTDRTDPGRSPAGGDVPSPSAAEIQALLRREAGLPSRLAYTALLVAGLLAGGVAAALLLTEPALPGRTRLAFGIMTAMGLAWAALAGWVLARRRVLYAGHRVAGALMAVAFTAVFTLGAALVGRGDGGGPGWPTAVAVGATLLAVALLVLARAWGRHRALTRRRGELERALAVQGRMPG